MHTVSSQYIVSDIERLRLEHMCKVCAQSALLLWFYNDFRCEAVQGVFGTPGANFAYFYTDFTIALFCLNAQIAISLRFYTELLHFLESIWGSILYVFAGVEIMTIFCYSLYAKMF